MVSANAPVRSWFICSPHNSLPKDTSTGGSGHRSFRFLKCCLTPSTTQSLASQQSNLSVAKSLLCYGRGDSPTSLASGILLGGGSAHSSSQA
jgi:hypothetical protein